MKACQGCYANWCVGTSDYCPQCEGVLASDDFATWMRDLRAEMVTDGVVGEDNPWAPAASDWLPFYLSNQTPREALDEDYTNAL